MSKRPFLRTVSAITGTYRKHQELFWLIVTCASIGIGAMCLACLGNPKNSGLCVSCFLENLAGSLGLHDNVRMQYIRPELIGFVLGGTLSAMFFGEFKVVGGRALVPRFVGGFLMILGSAIFIGCPIRLISRLAGGDGSALVGVPGLVLGIWLGLLFLRNGFDLGESVPRPKAFGAITPLFAIALLAAVALKPDFLHFSWFGPGAQHATIKKSLAIGLLIGFGAQRSRYCLTGSIGQFIATRQFLRLAAPVLTLLFALGTSLHKHFLHPSFTDQAGSHLAYGWSFLGMMLVGLVATLLSGCPFRQIILAAQGSTDGAVTFFGMLAGAAAVESWGLASTSQGPTAMGVSFLLAGFALVFVAVVVIRIREE